MTAKDFTLSLVFCSDVLVFFPHYQLCVNQGFHFVGFSSGFLSPLSTLCESGFPFCWFFFRSMLPRKDQMAEVTTLLADRPLLEAFHIHLLASSTASSVFVLLLSTSPSIFFRMGYQN